MRCQVVVSILALATAGTGQAQTAKKLAFEVASVRSADLGTSSAMNVTPGRVDIRNMPLWSVLMFAFAVEDHQLSGPDWVREQRFVQRFDIQATIPAGATRDQVPGMMQTLLAERFGLVTHVEPRPVDVYELLIGKDGLKMREVEPVDELAKPFSDLSGKPVLLDSVAGPPDNQTRTILRSGGGMRVVTARTMYDSQRTERGTRQIDATRMTMVELAGLLRGSVDRPVIDKTGVTGVYQFKIELPPLAVGMHDIGITTTRTGEPINRDPSGVSVFKAVEGLGLTLERGRSPIDVVVIDKIARTPTSN